MCPGSHNVAVCSKKDAQLCTAGSSQRGTLVTTSRRKRSVTSEEREEHLAFKRAKIEIENDRRSKVLSVFEQFTEKEDDRHLSNILYIEAFIYKVLHK